MKRAKRLSALLIIVITLIVVILIMMIFLSCWLKQMPTNNIKDFDFEFGHYQNHQISVGVHASFYENDDDISNN